ncbi:hypothetical protein NC661_01260 [Aquibacillus koreensis]|uniref:Resolvase HTH domain-containing protein n=1 Tax=Aquibacillus koreensis TaxID=279446 RepID=A0A9X3WIA8_9BACI|nr:hypothetical protein [Aquibacillus koreensis]MCT2537564.1 hypothetical protein [Aquibacillus koreensis]MDC3419010.1 hypothetical protein [Aquibacillus koreensis]
MIITIISLITVAIVLFILSFFMNDRFKQIEEQLEQLSISSLQDSYQLKKKMKILEEELLPEELIDPKFQTTKTVHSPLMQKINQMYRQGYSVNDIAKETELSEYDVHSIVNQLKEK